MLFSVLLWSTAHAIFGSFFVERYKIVPEKAEHKEKIISFGGSIDSFQKDKTINLIVGAPKEDNLGKLYWIQIDENENIHSSVLKLECAGKSLSECLKNSMVPTIETKNMFIGSTLKIINDDLWFCDSRTKAKAMCYEDYFDPEEGWKSIPSDETKCRGLITGVEDPQNNEILRDFTIGGCYVIEEFKKKLSHIAKDGLKNEDFRWFNPCFTYNDNRELDALNYLTGRSVSGVPGSRFDSGYYNMNCKFGTSIEAIKYSDSEKTKVLIGAAAQHHQGSIFQFDQSEFYKYSPLASGLNKITTLIKEDKLIEYTMPDYEKIEDVDANNNLMFPKTENADIRSGSRLLVVTLGNREYIVDSALNDLNEDHKKTGCVRFFHQEANSITFDGEKIGSLQMSSDVLESGRQKVCGVLSHESFGFATEVADVNKDGKDDLIIGAPRYTWMHSGGSSRKSLYDVGRIIILLQTEDGLLDDSKPIEIRGTDVNGQFGFGIETAGDLNSDGVTDLLVSAPYAHWDRSNPEGATGKLYAIFGSESGTFCADNEKLKSDNGGYQCLSNNDNFDYIKDSKGFGTTVNVQSVGEKKIIHVAAGESDAIFGVQLMDVHKFSFAWKKEQAKVDDQGKLKYITADLCVKYISKPPNAKNPNIIVKLDIDDRLLAPVGSFENEITIQPEYSIKKKGRTVCQQIMCEIQLYAPSVCDNNPFVMKVVSARLEENTESFGLDIGCMNKLPVIEVALPEADGKAIINVSVQKNIEEVRATVMVEPVDVVYNIELEVKNADNMRNPFLLIDYDPNESRFDQINVNNGWEQTSCPNRIEMCSDYDQSDNLRRCARKSLGASLSSEYGVIKSEVKFQILATGQQKEISLNVQIYSCGQCNRAEIICKHGLTKSDNKCSSIIQVKADQLINPDDVQTRITKNVMRCESGNEAHHSSNIELKYKAKISGETTILEGDLMVIFYIPGYDWIENPCEGNTIGGLGDHKCSRTDDGELKIKITSSDPIDAINFSSSLSAVKELIIKIVLEPVEKCSEIDAYYNMTSVTKINHILYDEPSVVLQEVLQAYRIIGRPDIVVSKIHIGWWILIGCTIFFLILAITFCIYRCNQKPKEYEATVEDNKNENAKQCIIVTQ